MGRKFENKNFTLSFVKKKMLPQNLLSKSTHKKLIIFINKKGYIYEF